MVVSLTVVDLAGDHFAPARPGSRRACAAGLEQAADLGDAVGERAENRPAALVERFDDAVEPVDHALLEIVTRWSRVDGDLLGARSEHLVDLFRAPAEESGDLVGAVAERVGDLPARPPRRLGDFLGPVPEHAGDLVRPAVEQAGDLVRPVAQRRG